MIKINLLEPVNLTPLERATAKAIEEIHSRSFSGRNPELGKMINCHCGRRHRESEKHDMKYIAEAGKTPATESLIEERRIRLTVGAAAFKWKRRKPHLNKRANEFVQLVYSLVPDIYTHEQLEKARRKAKRILAKKYGRHGFLPPVWQKQKEAHEHKAETDNEPANWRDSGWRWLWLPVDRLWKKFQKKKNLTKKSA